MVFYILAGIVIGAGVTFFGLLILGLRGLQEERRQQHLENMQALEEQERLAQLSRSFEERNRINLN